MAIQVRGGYNLPQSSSRHHHSRPVFIRPFTIKYFGTEPHQAGKHRKDIHENYRKHTNIVLDTKLRKANHLIISRRHEEALNHFIYTVFPTALKLIVDVERWIMNENKEKLKNEIKRSKMPIDPNTVAEIEEQFNASLKDLVGYFYGKMNEQIVSILAHLNQCKENGDDGWDPYFLRKETMMRLAELYRGEFKSKTTDIVPVYVGEKYRYLITKVVFTFWKSFLFMYSLDTGNNFPALKKDVWYPLDDYIGSGEEGELGEPREEEVKGKMKPMGDLVICTKAGIDNVLTGTIDNDVINDIAAQYLLDGEDTISPSDSDKADSMPG